MLNSRIQDGRCGETSSVDAQERRIEAFFELRITASSCQAYTQTMTNKMTYWCWILVLSAFCREVQARGSIIPGHETTSLASEREALHNERLYEEMVDLRSHDPTQFDHLHPILGDLLTEQSSFEYWLNRWEAHPARFEHWHPWFWRIIDGEALEGGPPVITPLVPPAGQGGEPPAAPGPLSPTGQPGLASTATAVPEPGSLHLLLVALGLFLAVRGSWIKGYSTGLG